MSASYISLMLRATRSDFSLWMFTSPLSRKGSPDSWRNWYRQTPERSPREVEHVLLVRQFLSLFDEVRPRLDAVWVDVVFVVHRPPVVDCRRAGVPRERVDVPVNSERLPLPETKSSRMPASLDPSVSGATEPVSMNEGPSTDSSMETAGAPEPERRFVWSRSFIADRPNSSTETVASFSDSYSSAEIVSARAATSHPTRRFLTPCYRHRRRCRRRYCCFRHCPRFHHSRHPVAATAPAPDHQFRYILRAPRAPMSPAPFISRRRPYRA